MTPRSHSSPASPPAAAAIATTAPRPFAVTRYELASPPTGEHFRFATSSRSGDGKFRFVWTLAPGKRGPGEHSHPHETETFEIVSGTMRISMNGETRDYRPGDVVAIPPGTLHAFFNPEKVPAVANVTLDGPRLEDVFVPAAVAQAEKKSIRNFLRFMANTCVGEGSVPNNAFAVAIAPFLFKVLRFFGIEPFEPVSGWDAQRI